MEEIAHEVAVIPLMIVNTYLVGNAQSWVLIDTGTPGSADKIKQAAEERFGPNARPKAILLTHGHFDHSGSAKDLAELWNVKVYAHRMEWPFLSDKSLYPPMDPTAPGFFAAISRVMPRGAANISNHLANLNDSLPSLGLADWQAIDTPGHTPGHVSFYRAGDGVLLAGDAFATLNMDNVLTLITKKPQVYRPAVPATSDWNKARTSVETLAKLKPQVIGAGHGTPMRDAADQLEDLAANFPVPSHGRYVDEPAQFDENGLTYVPPAPPDRAPQVAAGVAFGLVVAAAGVVLLTKRPDAQA